MAKEEGRSGEYGSQQIDLNAASKEDLMRVIGLDEDRAQDIINHIHQYGPFNRVDELDNIPGFAGLLTDEAKQKLIVRRKAA